MGLFDFLTLEADPLAFEIPFPSTNRNLSLMERLDDMRRRLKKGDIPTTNQDRFLELCQKLGLWNPHTYPSAFHIWDIQSKPIRELTVFPHKLPHAGNYDWIGVPLRDPPKWLWDSVERRSILVDPRNVPEYVAVSYTWGRWRNEGEDTYVPGTDWAQPVINPTSCDLSHAELKSALSQIPGIRYFWVDVLCIHQTDEKERAIEINKQGQIFAQAKAVLIYIWTMGNGNQLAHAMCNLGDLLLWSLRLSGPENREYSQHKMRGLDPEAFGTKLRNDP